MDNLFGKIISVFTAIGRDIASVFGALGGFISGLSGWMYTYLLVILLVAGGLFFTVRTKFVQFSMLKEQFRAVADKPKTKKGVSSFQALMVSTASRVGTGNIIGVSTAICMGGYGSVFWMWVIAVIGAASAFIESTLAQIFKRRGPQGSYGGPAYYIEQGLGKKGLAMFFSVLLVITYGVGFNMLASYNLQSTFEGYSFYNPSVTPWIIGLLLAVVVGFCLFGGGKRIINITTLLVPVMGIAYILVAIIIVIMNIGILPDVFSKIFEGAFDFSAIFGGITGSCLMYGIKRGLFSNEAGVGSAPNASASADVSHPVEQGLVQVLSVFIDTILVCSATAFMCLCSGVEATSEVSGAPYVQAALTKTLGSFGPVFITVAMVLFAFTTIIGNLFYVEKSFLYMNRGPLSKKQDFTYKLVACGLVLLGSGLSAGLLWDIADVTMGAMTIVNIPVILILGKYAYRALDDYKRQRKLGVDPEFKAQSIGIKTKTDYWN